MARAKDYEKHVREAVGAITQGDTIHLQWNSIPQARLHKSQIAQVQKQLRLIKKDIGLEKKAINASYTTEKTRVGKGFGAGLAAGLFGKKNTGKVNASMRDNIRRQQLQAIAPYEAVNRMIDNLLLQLDQVKIQIDSWIVENQK